jgi:glycosyltransferase involved in cell wall biosynthesis
VIIPCFNRERFIEEAIRTVLAQTFLDFEVVVVDDGSTDGSAEVVRKILDERVRLIAQRNRGPSEARNSGLAGARGQWVKFLDSDDLMEPNCLKEQLECMQLAPPNSVVVGTAISIDENGDILPIEKYNIACARMGAEIPLETLVSGCGSGQLFFFPRDALIDAGGFNSSVTISEDHDLILRLFERGYRFFLFDTPTIRGREHSGKRLTVNIERNSYSQLLEMYKYHLAALQKAQGGAFGFKERRAFAQLIWRVARSATRAHVTDIANDLFVLANDIAGTDARVGSTLVLLLYKIFTPVSVEHILNIAKSIVHSRMAV